MKKEILEKLNAKKDKYPNIIELCAALGPKGNASELGPIITQLFTSCAYVFGPNKKLLLPPMTTEPPYPIGNAFGPAEGYCPVPAPPKVKLPNTLAGVIISIKLNCILPGGAGNGMCDGGGPRGGKTNPGF